MPPPSVIRRNPPSAVVYDLSVPHQVTITLPAGSTWTSGLHWHETHTEYLRLVKGRIRLRLGDAVQTVSASLGDSFPSPPPEEIRVDRGVWHEWAAEEEEDEEEEEEEVVVVERTEPADGDKSVFFRSLNGVILEAEAEAAARALRTTATGRLAGVWAGLRTTLSLWAILDALDNFPVLLGVRDAGRRRGLVERGSRADAWLTWWETRWSHAVLTIASVLVCAAGEQAVRPRFTPAEEYAAWVLRKQRANNTAAPGRT
ncbi:uncharacterized protein P884DRAFT_251648 [Thermothelomyces heterothallicus CBS 202.75]|uniref:uncharacterized protein n=1 Tax=Thermothelomyces heterothallicus CBS 202.75 TaxID=1149848 RepID=UPI0037434E74